MEYHFFKESSRWHESRDKRKASFIRFCSYLMIVGGFFWLGVSIVQRLYPVTLLVMIMVSSGFIALYLLRKGRITYAQTLIFASSTLYFIFVTVFVDGPDDVNKEPGIAYFWYIVLSIFFYFTHYNTKPVIRDTVALLLLFVFFLFHFRYISFPSIMHVEQRDTINKITMITALTITFILTRQFAVQTTKAEEALTAYADRLQGLIENILPKQVADRLTKENKSFADSFTQCSVMFADIVGFTAWAEKHSPAEVADLLNSVFSKFDETVDRRKVTKIKTNGDTYMVVAGIPEPMEDHALQLVGLALEFHEIASGYQDLKFRIGINSGSVAAGVIGKKRFIYDLWGDTVNTASRMESSGEPGKVNISGSTYELVKDIYTCTNRGKIEAKNKGMIDMYFVEEKA